MHNIPNWLVRSLQSTALILACYAVQTNAIAQTAAATAAATKDQTVICEPVKTMLAERLFGDWRVVFTKPPAGLPTQALMHLERHAQFSESLAGTLSRKLGLAKDSPAIAGHSELALLAGDLEEGLLLLDESSDKVSITGTWNGEMVPGSCGQQFKGIWKDASSSAAPDTHDVPFTLTRLP